MKRLIAALPLLVALTAVAYAETCYTNCYWLGDVEYCTTTCNP